MENMSTKEFIVITSIFQPTEAIYSYAAINPCQVIVVGDKKTPDGWNHDNVKYLPVKAQEGIGKYLHKLLPFNHYSRKMLGYLYSIERKAEFIVDTDDDNIPKKNWGFPSMEGSYSFIPDNQGFINIYQLYADQKIWPRGLPLSLIGKQFDLEGIITTEQCKVGIWQGLVDEDPDVDAIYRLTMDKPCYFKERDPIVLGRNTISPLNSQNTFITKELFPLLYLPAFVTFRFTDILRGLVAQPIMWMYDYHVGFTNATVVQKRNYHSYYNDFLLEIPVYKYCEQVIGITTGALNSTYNIADNLVNAYEALHKKSIVKKRELKVLEAWLKDVEDLGKG